MRHDPVSATDVIPLRSQKNNGIPEEFLSRAAALNRCHRLNQTRQRHALARRG